MRSATRQSRLELVAPLRLPLSACDANTLVALLEGGLPQELPAHPLFRLAEAATILVGESLDHDTHGSRLVREAEAGPVLMVSASLPSVPGLLENALAWLGGLITGAPGDLLGFVVPPDTHRHDMRLLVWCDDRLVRLGAVPDSQPEIRLEGDASCSPEAFLKAAGLPPPTAPAAEVLPVMQRVALALAERRALPVAQQALDGPLRHGQGMFRVWLADAALARYGFTTRSASTTLDAIWPRGPQRTWN